MRTNNINNFIFKVHWVDLNLDFKGNFETKKIKFYNINQFFC